MTFLETKSACERPPIKHHFLVAKDSHAVTARPNVNQRDVPVKSEKYFVIANVIVAYLVVINKCLK